MKDLTLNGVRKEFTSPDRPPVVAVQDVDLAVEKGELVTLLGPSGCGKTTLLRMIAGFEEPTSGDIFFGERRVNNDPPNARDAAMVFQSYAIFPHLNVFDNVAFGLRLQHLKRAELRERTQHVLALTGLSGYETRSPSQLSGGQQQRVALARCIVMEPRLLLFDEPLSNLDAKLREQMRVEIRDLQLRLGITTVYVTHDQVEAMSISDRILIMNEGAVEQIGSPPEIYGRPANRFVADFIGKANFADATVLDRKTVKVADAVVPVQEHAFPAQERVTLVLRPETLSFGSAGESGALPGTLLRTMFLGSVAECTVEVPGFGTWLLDIPNPVAHKLPVEGEQVFIVPAPGIAAVIAAAA